MIYFQIHGISVFSALFHYFGHILVGKGNIWNERKLFNFEYFACLAARLLQKRAKHKKALWAIWLGHWAGSTALLLEKPGFKSLHPAEPIVSNATAGSGKSVWWWPCKGKGERGRLSKTIVTLSLHHPHHTLGHMWSHSVKESRNVVDTVGRRCQQEFICFYC